MRLIFFWTKLIGSKTEYSLEARIFHAVCILLIAGIGVNVVSSYLMGISELVVLLSAVVFIAGAFFYVSKVKRKLNASIIAFQIFVQFALAFNYYFNSGINGPTFTIFLLSFLVTVTIIPEKQYWIWLPVNIILMLSLIGLEYIYPSWITVTYQDRESRFFDFALSYVIIAAFTLLVASYIRKSYNEQRKELSLRAATLEITNTTKNKLLSVLAHDLKEPLASIQGYLELLSAYELEDAERKEIENSLLHKTKDASLMLANLLSWAKGQMESLKVNLLELPLLQTLLPVISSLKNVTAEKGIDLIINIDEGIIVLADRDMLQLVIRNLLTNAIKFTHRGGSIRLQADCESDCCVISVTDSGIGIPKDKFDSIFSLNAKSTFGTAQEKGTGLGLTLCREFTELQGGKIYFESKEGNGSKFSVAMQLSH
ncbi:sensor histidine kinase [Mucilaginibacter sp. Bleaf8]|uniref:ATP-binding protein n=1 Tax=Mucilaginibacter sp. Bleaf8 TaxID=2834430 RepID=UPI001BCE384F|nr:ATP-binding protein [Mucilaginibacter sp. Bleaf8]MBS7563289.1 sensor histidine kinase [Mucilaginibacter sp. Bleaf8]